MRGGCDSDIYGILGSKGSLFPGVNIKPALDSEAFRIFSISVHP